MNTYLKTLAVASAVAFGSMGFAVADDYNQRTIMTIDEPVQLPTTVLQPGTYVIKLLGVNDRHTVEFFDKGEKHLITTIMAMPNYRLKPTGKTVFAFWETPAGQPKALRAWFYPGDNFGQEFAYPKDEAARISARNNNEKVPIDERRTADVAAQDNTNAAPTAAAAAVPAPTPSPVTAAAAEPPPAPAPAPVEVAAAQQPAPAADTSSDAQRVNSTPAPAPAPAALPQTASNLPLFAVIGMLLMGAALALKVAYNRS